MIWKQFLYNFMVLLNGPVQNALFCLMDRYRNVCVWFMARNCRFPKVGTHGCQRGNHRLPLQRICRFPEVGTHGSQPGNQRLPLQATAGSQRLELMLPDLGTIEHHCKELPIPKGWNWWFPIWEPWQGKAGKQRLPLQGLAGSQKLEFMFSKLSNYHSTELPVAKAWNSWFQTWKSNVTVEGSVDCKKLELMILNVFCFVYWAGNRTFCFANGLAAECLRSAAGPAIFFHEKRCMSKW